MKKILLILLGILNLQIQAQNPFIVILGIAQDGGYPQAGCKKECCNAVWENKQRAANVACLAIVDPKTKQRWLIDATPDFKNQLEMLDRIFPVTNVQFLNGIFLTHAHIGHYIGLIHLGREVMGTQNIPVYTMPQMFTFLNSNGPWNQLIKLENIKLIKIEDQKSVQLNNSLYVKPILVPHRDEYSETVGYIIKGPQKSVLYIPDIDKWEKWSTPVESVIKQVDLAFLDGTFFANGEIPGRDMVEIPHPFIEESMLRFKDLPETEKDKIFFIHFNHTNPAIQEGTLAVKKITMQNFKVARETEKFEL